MSAHYLKISQTCWWISFEVKQLVLKYNRNIIVSSMLHSSEVKCYQYSVVRVRALQQQPLQWELALAAFTTNEPF